MLYAVQLGINNSYHRKIAKGVCMYTTSPKFQLHHGEITLLTITRHFFVFSWHWCVRQKTVQECLTWMEDAFSLKLCHSEENLRYD